MPKLRRALDLRLAARAASLLRWFARHGSDVLFVLLACSLWLWVSHEALTSRVATLSPGADYWEHSATLRALQESPLHPKNPHLVSSAPSPRFIPSFILVALLANAWGLDALGAMAIASSLNTLVLLLGIYAFFRVYFRDARASVYGLVLMFGSWYDAWHFSNVYQLKIFFDVASYPSTVALGLCLLGFSFTLNVLRGGRADWKLGAVALLWALVMVTHPLTAMLGFSGAGLLALFEPRVRGRLRLLVLLALVLALGISTLWPYFSVPRVLSGGSHDSIDAISQRFAGTGGEASGRLHQFYRVRGLLNALGLALLGLPVVAWLLVVRRHWFISLGALAMLLPFAANTYVAVPLGHRFVLLAIFYLQTALVWLLLKLSRGSREAFAVLEHRAARVVGYAVVCGVLGLAAYVNLPAALEHVESSARRGVSPTLRYARRVGELAGDRAVILGDARSSWPLPSFGPKVLVLLHENPLVPDSAERERAVGQFLSASREDAERLRTLERYGVTHVVLGRRQIERLSGFLAPIARRVPLPGGYVLFALKGARAGTG